jgi:hypothetical protein
LPLCKKSNGAKTVYVLPISQIHPPRVGCRRRPACRGQPVPLQTGKPIVSRQQAQSRRTLCPSWICVSMNGRCVWHREQYAVAGEGVVAGGSLTTVSAIGLIEMATGVGSSGMVAGGSVVVRCNQTGGQVARAGTCSTPLLALLSIFIFIIHQLKKNC